MGFFGKTEQQEHEIPREIVDLRTRVKRAELPDQADAICLKGT
jgi:hypothetical protein